MPDQRDMQADSALYLPNRRHHDAGSSFTIRPHEGYRQYFEGGVQPTEIPALFTGDDLTSNFPSVRYAAGWAHADYAIGPDAKDIDDRSAHIAAAEEQWQEAIRLTGVTYELLPGRFLLWPCTKWRYQFAVDTVPTLQAMAYAKESRQHGFDDELLEQSRTNVNDTVRRLMGKYAWTLKHFSEDVDDPVPEDTMNGRLGSILGVALEGAAVSTVQLAGSNKYAVLPPSLRDDLAGRSAVDIVAHTTRRMIFSAQLKKRVNRFDRKKYRGVALICGVHHMAKMGEDIVDVANTIASDTDQDKSRQIGQVLLKVMQGSQQHGCSPLNPRPAHTRGHVPRVALGRREAA